MAAEMCLLQLPALLSGEPDAQFLPSPFFAEQLTAFELWLAHGSSLKQPPEQLPIVLQASSQFHTAVRSKWRREFMAATGSCLECEAPVPRLVLGRSCCLDARFVAVLWRKMRKCWAVSYQPWCCWAASWVSFGA